MDRIQTLESDSLRSFLARRAFLLALRALFVVNCSIGIVIMAEVRRSSRTRQQATSIYDEAKKEIEEKEADFAQE